MNRRKFLTLMLGGIGAVGTLAHGWGSRSYEYPTGPGYSNGYSIMTAQIMLRQLGYKPGTADGILGPQTKRAIRAFQRNKRLPITGELDYDTMANMMLAKNGRHRRNPVLQLNLSD